MQGAEYFAQVAEHGPAILLDGGQRLPGGGPIGGHGAEPGRRGGFDAAQARVQAGLEVGADPGPVGQDGQAGGLLALAA